MTNYEKIKNMSVHEMARHIELNMLEVEYCKSDCEWAGDEIPNMPEGECIKCAEKWLREETE